MASIPSLYDQAIEAHRAALALQDSQNDNRHSVSEIATRLKAHLGELDPKRVGFLKELPDGRRLFEYDRVRFCLTADLRDLMIFSFECVECARYIETPTIVERRKDLLSTLGDQIALHNKLCHQHVRRLAGATQ